MCIRDRRVAFGTSGHRGTSFNASFNEWHVLAITQAICQYRKEQGIGGPLFMGIDTHALSMPAYVSALEVLAANGVDLMLAENDEYTPTPAISHAILTHNRRLSGPSSGQADGIVVTPSHNPVSYTHLDVYKRQIIVNGVDVVAEVHSVLGRMAVLANAVRSGQWLGYTCLLYTSRCV